MNFILIRKVAGDAWSKSDYTSLPVFYQNSYRDVPFNKVRRIKFESTGTYSSKVTVETITGMNIKYEYKFQGVEVKIEDNW